MIELVEGLSAMLDIVKALLGPMESCIANITFVMTLGIKGAIVAREKHSSQIIDQVVEQLQ